MTQPIEDFSQAIGVLAAEWEVLTEAQRLTALENPLVRRWRDHRDRYSLSLDDYRQVYRALAIARGGQRVQE